MKSLDTAFHFYLLLSTEGVDLRGPPGPPGPRGPPGKNSLIFGRWGVLKARGHGHLMRKLQFNQSAP